MRTKSLTITKVPQCRHSEHQGFVTYAVDGFGRFKATCSNCASVGSLFRVKKEDARFDLMKIEAPPLVP